MTVTVLSTGFFGIGNMVTGSGIPLNTYIVEQLTGAAGGVGTYRLSQSTTFSSGAVTLDGAGPWIYKDSVWSTFQVSVDGTGGTIAVTCVIDGSNDGIHIAATALATVTLTGAALSASDGATVIGAWKYVRARVTSIGGTNAVAICQMSV
jgi:hypothetical protein